MVEGIEAGWERAIKIDAGGSISGRDGFGGGYLRLAHVSEGYNPVWHK